MSRPYYPPQGVTLKGNPPQDRKGIGAPPIGAPPTPPPPPPVIPTLTQTISESVQAQMPNVEISESIVEVGIGSASSAEGDEAMTESVSVVVTEVEAD